MNSLIKIFLVIFFYSFIFMISMSDAGNKDNLAISKIHYTEKEITEIPEISFYAGNGNTHEELFKNKVDELIDLLESHKNAAEQGQDIDRLQEKVIEINHLLEEQKAGPPKITLEEFHNSICFKCHTVNDFSPKDKTKNQWRRLIGDDGHSIFKDIYWNSSYQKKQVLEFLIENAGAYRAEGIGLWD